MPALFAISSGLALDREMGLLRLKRAQPAPRRRLARRENRRGHPLLRDRLSAHARRRGVERKGGASRAGARRDEPHDARGSVCFCAMGLMIGALVKGTAAPGYANVDLSSGVLPLGHVLPAAAVDALAGADLAAVPRRSDVDACRGPGRGEVPVHAVAALDRGLRGIHGAVRAPSRFWKLSRKGLKLGPAALIFARPHFRRFRVSLIGQANFGPRGTINEGKRSS